MKIFSGKWKYLTLPLLVAVMVVLSLFLIGGDDSWGGFSYSTFTRF